MKYAAWDDEPQPKVDKQELPMDDTETVPEAIRDFADSSYDTRSEIESSHDDEKTEQQDGEPILFMLRRIKWLLTDKYCEKMSVKDCRRYFGKTKVLYKC